jgi:hypothetical protein
MGWTVEEEWREIAGFPGYFVSDLGNVRGPRARRLRADAVRGYLRVWLCASGRRVRRQVSHLVLEAFTGPRPLGAQARHVHHNDPSCNRRDNLEWGTAAQNAADRDRHGTTAAGPRNGWCSIRDDDVAAIHEAHTTGRSARAIARQLGISHTHVGRILRGENRTKRRSA